jgi:hypothetical protein
MTIVQMVLLVALAGLMASTGFLLLAVWASFRYRNRRSHGSSAERLPPATLLKPLCGSEPNLEFGAQEYRIEFAEHNHILCRLSCFLDCRIPADTIFSFIAFCSAQCRICLRQIGGKPA